MKVPVYNQDAEQVGDVELNSKVFEIAPDLHLMAESVRVQLSNARKGLAHTKTRGEVRGGGKKPWKQKGTGRARAGSIRSPLWRSGGITFGPRSDRNWSLKLNKKAKVKALFMSLSDKAKEGKLVVVENIELSPVKTKGFVKILEAFNGKIENFGKNKLIVLPKKSEDIMKASRNIPKVSSSLASALNIVDILKADSLVVLKDSLPVIEKTFLKTEGKAVVKK